MKKDIVLYEKIYKHLKNKIECGLLLEGQQLPSRADMCREYETSEKPVRCAIEMLARDGLVKTEPRKRPTVIYRLGTAQKTVERSIRKAASTAADDILKSAILLCYPVIGRGISLCGEEDWVIPETIVQNMDSKETTKFWRLSNSFWRFFIARNGNELILRTVDSLGYSDQDSLLGSYEVRSSYLQNLNEFLCTVKAGKDPAGVRFEDMSSVYGFSREGKELGRVLQKSEERHSGVCLDILGLIDMGWYKPGERLPSHKELQQIYGVSVDTTLRAVKTLKEWGVVKAAPNKGIWVTMDLDEIKRVYISPELIASHVRRFLDSLELLELTMEGVAFHAMEHTGKGEAEQFYAAVVSYWKDPILFHLFPSMILEFITDHIRYETLRSIYGVLRNNFRIGRGIPKMISRERTGEDHENHKKCLGAAAYLMDGDKRLFAALTAELFRDIRFQIIAACKKTGYWEAAMRVYDGETLWR